MLHACRVRGPAGPTSCHRVWTPIKYCENKQEPPPPPVILHSAAVCSRDPGTYWECSSWRKRGRKEQWQNCRDSGFWMPVRFPGQLCTVQSREHTALRSPIRVFGTWWAVWEQVTLEMSVIFFWYHTASWSLTCDSLQLCPAHCGPSLLISISVIF